LPPFTQTGAPSFGREDRRTTGSRGLPNEPAETWAEFYGQSRLIPRAKLAGDAAVLPAETIGRLETLAGRLELFGAADEPPARLHGDLWAGNRLVDGTGRSWLVDPAAHGGHREFDLAMMRLFGGFGACFQAYEERHPLAPGWEGRVALQKIAPLVVHAIKFGGSYVPRPGPPSSGTGSRRTRRRHRWTLSGAWRRKPSPRRRRRIGEGRAAEAGPGHADVALDPAPDQIAGQAVGGDELVEIDAVVDPHRL
jgi:hypothetical protein